jgi:hypothetical protein
MEPSIPLSHSSVLVQGANLAGYKAGKSENQTTILAIGLVLGAFVVAGLVLLGTSRSSADADYSLQAGAVAQVPQTQGAVTPITAQSVTASSSSTVPGWGS